MLLQPVRRRLGLFTPNFEMDAKSKVILSSSFCRLNLVQDRHCVCVTHSAVKLHFNYLSPRQRIKLCNAEQV